MKTTICSFLFVMVIAAPAAGAEPALRLDAKSQAIHVTGLSKQALAALRQLPAEKCQEMLSIRVHGDVSNPPVLGTCAVQGDILVFQPRFPLVPGIRYCAQFDPATLPGAGATISAEFGLPAPAKKPTVVVAQVYPSAGELPENQLKFYIHFSGPMSRGEAYQHIKLLDAAGKAVSDPFLELGEELWDADCKRFTLFIDPGRIKRGLQPREEAGPVLEAGKSYTLVIDAGWQDAQSQALRAPLRKSFKAGPPVDKVLDTKDWKLQAPAAGTRAPLSVAFPRPLDHALLGRVVWVIDAKGSRILGTVSIQDEEKSWQFTPEKPWQPGAYRLVADKVLEDLAGNNLERAFEVDMWRPAPEVEERATVAVPFQVSEKK